MTKGQNKIEDILDDLSQSFKTEDSDSLTEKTFSLFDFTEFGSDRMNIHIYREDIKREKSIPFKKYVNKLIQGFKELATKLSDNCKKLCIVINKLISDLHVASGEQVFKIIKRNFINNFRKIQNKGVSR
jgi:phosphoenolpyruvate synthase/pyruvate phosphate dikinase